MSLQPPKIRDERVVVKFDKDLVERVNDLANRRYEGNRSFLVRFAVIALLNREERELADRDDRTAA